jgi:hypothetical protein
LKHLALLHYVADLTPKEQVLMNSIMLVGRQAGSSSKAPLRTTFPKDSSFMLFWCSSDYIIRKYFMHSGL